MFSEPEPHGCIVTVVLIQPQGTGLWTDQGTAVLLPLKFFY